MSAAAIYAGFARNNAYANQTIYAALKGMGEAEFVAPRPGFFPSLAETLNHIYLVDLYYIDALENAGERRRIFDRPDVVDVAALAQAQASADARLVQFCQGLSDGDLTAPVEIERRDGMTHETVGAVLPHLFQHQIHHRGQVHVQIGDAGIASPPLDEFFLEFERAPLAVAARERP